MKNRMKELRESKGYTESELAAILNVSQQSIHSVEGGKEDVPIELAVKAADFFNISLEDFLCLSECPHADFLEGFDKLNSNDQKTIQDMIHGLKKVQDMYK